MKIAYLWPKLNEGGCLMAKPKHVILAVDDEEDMLATYKAILGRTYDLKLANSGEASLEMIKKDNIDLVILDILMPKMDGIEALRRIKEASPGVDVIIVTASKEIKSAVECMKMGAYDYVTKPFEVDELKAAVAKALEKKELLLENFCLKAIIKESESFCELIGASKLMKDIFRAIDDVAKTDSTVLITGESGTGKELVAKAIHKKSGRAEKPFVAINCAAIPDNLLESELFGFEAGSFTGAFEKKLGKFELASGGTVFLDEIGCMSPAMQAKLLRVLEEKAIDRIGGRSPMQIDVRIIAASNINFRAAIIEGKFREDLYYRLNVIPIHMPSLRERKEDVPFLLDHFLRRFNKEFNKKVAGFTEEAASLLLSYQWPGNVRELENMMERIVVLSKNGKITSSDLPIGASAKEEPKNIKPLSEAVYLLEKAEIDRTLKNAQGNKTKAAKILGIHRTTLLSKMRALRMM